MNLIQKKHHQQEDDRSCVFASLAMVWSAYGKEVSQSEFRDYMGATQRGTQIDVTWNRIPFEKWDLECEIKFDAKLEERQASLNAGVPVIAIVRSVLLPYSDRDFLHAIVIVGIDQEYVYINDPLTDGQVPIRMSQDTFLQAWEWYARCAIIIKPHECDNPSTN